MSISIALELESVRDCQLIKGIPFAPGVKFRQIVVTGPPGSGKTTFINRIGGWPEEGYVDLTFKGWWKVHSLNLRPREIHLGLPFTGHQDALAMFEEEWLGAWDRLELDPSRILLPPRKRFFFSVDWRARFVFEFLLPAPEKIFSQRKARAELGTHPVDEHLDPDQVRRQCDVFAQTAVHFHRNGMLVYIRKIPEEIPHRIVADLGETKSMTDYSRKSRKNFLGRFRELVAELGGCEDVELKDTIHIASRKIRVPSPVIPLQIMLGEQGKRLFLYPEVKLTEAGEPAENGALLLFDPDDFFSTISGFLRLFAGESLTLGRESALQRDLLKLPKLVGDRHLSLKRPVGGLIFKDRSPELGTCISPLTRDKKADRIASWRHAKLQRLARVLEKPVEPIPRDAATDLIDAVIDQVEHEPCQTLDSQGRPGGVIELPRDVIPIFVGDLHARIDNLLVILTQNAFLEALEKGTGALIFLGDAVHSDEDGCEDKMQTSMLIMDLIFRLKLRFPGQVYYLRGNHDSFSEDISKQGVPQGLLWEQALHETRGSKYVRAMARLYDALPYVALSRRIVACHAGAPTRKISLDMLINIRQHPELEKEITHIRLQRPNAPSGYNARDVKRMRSRLDLDPQTPLIVGHTPLSCDDTLWLNAGGIANHHVLFGANPDWIGVITQVGKRLIPLRYPAEPLLPLFNRLVPTRRGVTD